MSCFWLHTDSYAFGVIGINVQMVSDARAMDSWCEFVLTLDTEKWRTHCWQRHQGNLFFTIGEKEKKDLLLFTEISIFIYTGSSEIGIR